jgi:predicted ATPase
LIGANGSGKSNFISVFRLLENISTQRLQTYIKQNGGAERFLHVGNQTTDEIEIYLEIRDKKYLVFLAKNNEEDTFIKIKILEIGGNGLYCLNYVFIVLEKIIFQMI